MNLLAYNFDCPDWVHIYLATTQLYTTFERIVEEPKFFFERLLKVDFNNRESKKELHCVLGKYLCMIIEQSPQCAIALEEIIQFAEKVGFTSSNEFKLFHQSVCPNIEYKEKNSASEDAAKEVARFQGSESSAKQKAAELEKELTRVKSAEETSKKQLQAQSSEIEKLKADKDALRSENSAMAERLKALETATQTAMQPSNIDDVFFKITGWLNVLLKRYLAQWLTENLSRSCKNDFWNKKVKKALRKKELDKFVSYKELTDFAIDALLNIYYSNLDDFHPYNSLGTVTK